jgi:hypothetical protein
LPIVPEDEAVSEVDVVEPLNLVKTDDDDDTLLLRLNRSLERQLLNRDRGSWRVVLPLSSEVTDWALRLQPFPLREFTLKSPIVGSASDQPLDTDPNSSRVLCRGLTQML